MRSHLNLEHKTFLGGKLPSCVSARSAAQGIQSDRCQYHSCNTDSNNENSTQLSLGFDSVTLSLLNLCPQQYVEFYRDVFKCLCSSGVVGHLLFVLRGITAVGALSSQGCLPATSRQHLGVHGGCLSFSFLFSCQPSLSSPAHWAEKRWACGEHWVFSEPALQFWCNLKNLSVCMAASNENIG